MILQKRQFLRNRRFHETELIRELVVGVGRKVVLFNVGFLALGVEEGEGVEEGVKRGEVRVQALDVGALVVDVAFEAGDGEGEGIEGEGEVVSFVGEGTAEGVFDAGGGD